MRLVLACSVTCCFAVVACGNGGASDVGTTKPDGSGTAGSGGATAGKGGAIGAAGLGGKGVSGSGGAAAIAGAGGVGGAGKAGASGKGGAAQAGNVGVGGASVGGAAGRAGTGGAAGNAGVGGSGGMLAATCSSYPPTACDLALCGNGVIDSCMFCNSTGAGGGPLGGGDPPPPPGPMGGGGFCSTSAEPCDGANVGGVTCTGVGYFSGSVTCTTGCALDDSACEACGPTSGALPGCNADATPGNALRVALAATDDTIALAWSDASIADDLPRVRITLFSADLTPLMTTAPFGPPGTVRVAIVPTTNGWLVAAESKAQVVEVHAVDASGTTQLAASVNGYDPMFGARPDGPLLAWIDGSSQQRVAFLSPTGVVTNAPPKAFGSVVEPEFGSVVFTGDAFLVSTRLFGASVFRVGLDGTVGNPKEPVGNDTEYPQIAFVGGETRMTYADFGVNPVGVRHVRLDAITGAPLSPPTVVANSPDEYNVAPLVPDEASGGVIGVFSGYTGGTGIGSHVDVRKLDANGSTTSIVHVAKSPGVRSYRIARRGTEIVVAWMGAGCGRVGLARVVP